MPLAENRLRQAISKGRHELHDIAVKLDSLSVCRRPADVFVCQCVVLSSDVIIIVQHLVAAKIDLASNTESKAAVVGFFVKLASMIESTAVFGASSDDPSRDWRRQFCTGHKPCPLFRNAFRRFDVREVGVNGPAASAYI